ncbi:MAG: hypothetical protein E6J88_14795 [Deltaproteobacteria bacterium]|nr:MAG: hypothetical protein E6J88_14795 [Deltaproteobacteria bacterium]
MKLSTILIGAGALALGGYVYYDYNSADSKNARELKEIEQLAPDVKAPSCFPQGLNARLFAIAISRDQRLPADLENDQTRRGMIEHDCIRGNQPATVQRAVKALGEKAVPVYAEVLEKCPVVKDEYPVYACFALDALASAGGKDSVAAMEKALTNKEKARKNVYLGALYRLMMTPGWKTVPQLAAMLPAETEWKAKELMLEYIRNHKDVAAKGELEKAYAAEQDQQEKGLIKAALLELDNPGKCVMTDEGRAENGTCRYTCHDINRWFSIPKPANAKCLLVVDPPAEVQQQQTPPVNTASPAAPAAAKQ